METMSDITADAESICWSVPHHPVFACEQNAQTSPPVEGTHF